MADRILPTETHGPAEPTHQHTNTPHLYNSPGLSPLEFLRAVMEDQHLPMSYRMEAAKALLPYTNSFPRPVRQGYDQCKIIIGGLGEGGPDPGSADELADDPTGNHSQNPSAASITVPHSGEPGDPQILRDYSNPPTSDDLLQIKTAINNLRPDLADFPIPEPRLCQCGHWLFGPCPLGDRCRDKSKLN